MFGTKVFREVDHWEEGEIVNTFILVGQYG